MGSISFLVMHSGRWNKENCYVDYSTEAIVLKEHATFRELMDLVSKQICVDLSFNVVKHKYKIEGSTTPLEIHNDMGVRVQLADRNMFENGFEMCGPDGIDIVDTEALVLSVPNNGINMNCDIITNAKHKVVLEDQVYKDKGTLKAVMMQYAINHRFQWKTDRSSQTCYTLVCVSDNCGWVLKSSSINKSGMFRIRKFVDDRTCPLKDKVYEQRQATSNLIGVAWKAKEKAVISLRGTPSGSYGKLSSYLYVLDATYPGSHIRMKKIDENQFLYLFISLFPFIKGFECCKSIVVVDGSHLRGTYNGVFVSASTVDGAGNLLPLAYGIIDSENDASWTWFLNSLEKRMALNITCALCSIETKAYKQSEFDELMKKVELVDVRVKNYLESAGYEKWARVYATVDRGMVMTSNIAECINACLFEARELPVYDFLKKVRQMIERWNLKNHTFASHTFTTLCGRPQEMLVANEEASLRMKVVPSNNYVFSVHHEGRTYIVCLENKTCTCKRFQIDEIPCSHAWTVLKKKHFDVGTYCSDLYKPSNLLNTYSISIRRLPDQNEWNVPGYIKDQIVQPPNHKNLPEGHPKSIVTRRIASYMVRRERILAVHVGLKGTIGVHVGMDRILYS
ncbi:uncharacterized protein LOC107019298 [Solanum pennellii]|uniref:Uncharacterized protein LOC107019298 n=1 Tax=Solanum pennellii TaxID=28526 RepID=A0ABM1GSN0_SOLPN|nr:uncharacterized protein LOC107019298 [Solanum pennellii]